MKEDCDRMTDLIISCWDSNQPCDEDGRPLDGLSFDERLAKKTKELKDSDQNLMDIILSGV